MKIFIWITSFLTFSVLNVILGYVTGFRIGSVLFYVIWYYSARAMCKAWDKHRISKKAKEAGFNPFEYIRAEIPEAVLVSCEENRGNYDRLKDILKAYAKEKQITHAYADILLDEYGNVQKPVEEMAVTMSKAENGGTVDQIRFCRKCGEQLLDGSRFCRNCGTEIVKIPQ